MIQVIKISICRLLVIALSLAILSPLAFAGQGAVAAAPSISVDEQKAAAQLKVETIREITTTLASTQMQGRGTGQLGGDRAAKYIADRFARAGLKPRGDRNSYQQSIRFKINTVLPESSLKIGDSVFKFKSDFIFEQPGSLRAKDVSGGLVFAG
jgi:hypothetical protein